MWNMESAYVDVLMLNMFLLFFRANISQADKAKYGDLCRVSTIKLSSSVWILNKKIASVLSSTYHYQCLALLLLIVISCPTFWGCIINFSNSIDIYWPLWQSDAVWLIDWLIDNFI